MFPTTTLASVNVGARKNRCCSHTAPDMIEVGLFWDFVANLHGRCSLSYSPMKTELRALILAFVGSLALAASVQAASAKIPRDKSDITIEYAAAPSAPRTTVTSVSKKGHPDSPQHRPRFRLLARQRAV
jgi:hypothetical protein